MPIDELVTIPEGDSDNDRVGMFADSFEIVEPNGQRGEFMQYLDSSRKRGIFWPSATGIENWP